MDKIEAHQALWKAHRAKQGHQAPPARKAATSRRRAPTNTVSRTSPAGSVSNKTSLMQIKLTNDLHRISLQASRQRKHALQRDMLPEYDDYLNSAMANPTGGDDPVLIQCMIWRYNLGDIEQATKLADHAITHGLSMPEQFKATVKQFVCREVAYWALAQQKEGNDPDPYLSDIYTRSRNWDKPDQIEARLLKAKGQQLIESNPAAALEYFEQAAPLDDRIGVSQIIKRLSKQLAKPVNEQQ